MKKSSFYLSNFSVLILISSSLWACSYPLESAGLYSSNSWKKLNQAESTTQTYGNQVINFEVLKATSLKTCQQCHSSGSLALNTPELVLALKTNVLKEVQTGEMPPPASNLKPLTPCEKQILETWFEIQNKNDSSIKIKDLTLCSDIKPPEKQDPPAEPIQDLNTLPATYENVQKYIFASKCLSCHATEAAEGDVILDSVQAIHDSGLLGATAEESKLFKAVSLRRGRIKMPPKDSGLSTLTEVELSFLKKWIDSGAKD